MALLKGKVKKVNEIQTGVSAHGNHWAKQTFIVEEIKTVQSWDEPETMLVDLFGEEQIKATDIHVGDEVEVIYRCDVREYQKKDGSGSVERNELRFKVNKVKAALPAQGAASAAEDDAPPF